MYAYLVQVHICVRMCLTKQGKTLVPLHQHTIAYFALQIHTLHGIRESSLETIKKAQTDQIELCCRVQLGGQAWAC